MTYIQTTDFYKDIATGKVGEAIFVSDFLDFLHLSYKDVTGVNGYQVLDTDFVSPIGLYEIKANYRDDQNLIIEEYSNVNELLGRITMGWFYRSKANVLVFVSKMTRSMVIVPFTPEFKKHYETIKANYELKHNRISIKGASKWQSAYRQIPLKAINGYFAIYRKEV